MNTAIAIIVILLEPAEVMDPAFFAHARGEAILGAFVLWCLPLAGVLSLIEHPR